MKIPVTSITFIDSQVTTIVQQKWQLQTLTDTTLSCQLSAKGQSLAFIENYMAEAFYYL